MKWAIALGPVCCIPAATALSLDTGVRHSAVDAVGLSAALAQKGDHHSWVEPGQSLAVGEVVPVPVYETPTVTHVKQPGLGYAHGSPLYKKQEVLKAMQDAELQKGLPQNGTNGTNGTAKANGTEGLLPGHASDNRTAFEFYRDYPLSMVFSNLVYIILVIGAGFLYQMFLRHRQSGGSREMPPIEGDHFTQGLFGFGNCGQDGHIYLTAFFCPAVRWAATVSSQKTTLLPYWPALAIMLGISVFCTTLWLAPFFLVIVSQSFGVAPGILTLIFVVILMGIIQSNPALQILDVFAMLTYRGSIDILGPVTSMGVYLLFWVTIALGVFYRQKLRAIFGHEPISVKTMGLDILSWWCCQCCVISQEAKEVERVLPARRRPSSSVEGPRFDSDPMSH